MANTLAAAVMAGGLGTRMKSATPKHLHPLLGRRMVDWVVKAAQEAGVDRAVVVASPDAADSYAGVEVAVQETARGTGDAVRCAKDALAGFSGDVLVLRPEGTPGAAHHASRTAAVRGRLQALADGADRKRGDEDRPDYEEREDVNVRKAVVGHRKKPT